MIVADVELSLELYKVSGWEGFGKAGHIGENGIRIDYPAYDLGTLRKNILAVLEKKYPEDKGIEAWSYYPELSKALLDGEDETAKFAIGMFRAGIFTK